MCLQYAASPQDVTQSDTKVGTFSRVCAYITELLKHRVHLELGCVAVVDTEASGFLVVGFVDFLRGK